jgi:TolB-like protein
MRKIINTFLLIETLLFIFTSCYDGPKKEQLIEMIIPVAFEVSRVTNKFSKSSGKVNIDMEYENIRFDNSYFPTGEMILNAKSSHFGNKLYIIKLSFNGSYRANCSITYPNGSKEYLEVNLAERNLIKGQTQNLDEHIISLCNKMIIDQKNISEQKIAIFEFPDLKGKYTLFGKYIGENLITELSKKGIKVVERGLLKELFKELQMKQAGIVEYGKDEIDRIIQITGATCIVTGTISIINDEIVINARVISKNGEIISSGKEILKRYLVPETYIKSKDDGMKWKGVLNE